MWKKNKYWFYVVLTCSFELVWVYGFNIAHTFWHWPIIIAIICVDFYFLTRACEKLPTGTVYAMFSGVGTVGTLLMDIFLFNASFKYAHIIFILLIVAGVIGLKLTDTPLPQEQKG